MTPAQWIERIVLVWFGLVLGLALSFQVFSGSRVYVTFKEKGPGYERTLDAEAKSSATP